MTDEPRDNQTDTPQDEPNPAGDTEPARTEPDEATPNDTTAVETDETEPTAEVDSGPDIDFQLVRSKLSRAAMSYLVALILIGFVALMSVRAGYRVDRLVPRSMVNWFRIGEVVWLVAGFVGLGTYVLNLMRRKAEELGDRPATADAVGETFVSAKRAAAFVFGLAGLLGLALVLAKHDPKTINLLLLIIPIVLLIMSWPTETGITKFAGQIESLRQGSDWPETTSSDESEAPAAEDHTPPT